METVSDASEMSVWHQHATISFPPSLLWGAAVSKSRPASMDLLLLHSRRSQTDLRPSDGRQLPQIPTSPQGASQGTGGELGGDGVAGDVRDHTYTEVGIRNNPTPTHCLDDGLYETVGVREGEAAAAAAKAACAPPSTSASTPASVRAAQSPSAQVNGNRNGNVSSHTHTQHQHATGTTFILSGGRTDIPETSFEKVLKCTLNF